MVGAAAHGDARGPAADPRFRTRRSRSGHRMSTRRPPHMINLRDIGLSQGLIDHLAADDQSGPFEPVAPETKAAIQGERQPARRHPGCASLTGTAAPDAQPRWPGLSANLPSPSSASTAATTVRKIGYSQPPPVLPNPSHCRNARSTRRTAAPPRWRRPSAATRPGSAARPRRRRWSRDRPASRRNRSWRRTAPCPAAYTSSLVRPWARNMTPSATRSSSAA